MSTPSNTLEQAIKERYTNDVSLAHNQLPPRNMKAGVIQDLEVDGTKGFFEVQTSKELQTNSWPIFSSVVTFNVYDRNWDNTKFVSDNLDNFFDSMAFSKLNVNIIASNLEDSSYEQGENLVWEYRTTYRVTWEQTSD